MSEASSVTHSLKLAVGIKRVRLGIHWFARGSHRERVWFGATYRPPPQQIETQLPSAGCRLQAAG